MSVSFDLKNIVSYAFNIAYAIIATSFVIKFVKNGDEREAESILLVFGFILIACFIPSIIAIAKKIRKQKAGKITSIFVFMGFYTTFLFVIMIYYFATFQSRHYTSLKESSFTNLISEYNRQNTESNFNPKLFSSLTAHQPGSNGILILELLKNGKIKTHSFNYYYLINNYQNENILPKKPEDIRYLIIVNPEDYEYVGLYSDGKTEGHRLVIKINSYIIGNDEIRLLETMSERGSLPDEYISSRRDSIVRGGGGDIDIDGCINALFGKIINKAVPNIFNSPEVDKPAQEDGG